jgi:hypothetical protein
MSIFYSQMAIQFQKVTYSKVPIEATIWTEFLNYASTPDL